MESIVKVISADYVTHDVKRFRLEKPSGFTFTPGQATEISVNDKAWVDKRNPFTFTCLTDDPFLEFIIKIYPERKGVTNRLGLISNGDELILREAWGAIEYKGPGYFIAGGAGITPFIAILRSLKGKAKLVIISYSFQTKQTETSSLGRNSKVFWEKMPCSP